MIKTLEQVKPEYISVGYIARHCGVSNTTVLRWIEAGQLQAFRLPGGHHRIGRDALSDFLKKYNIP
jgi:excisionase family DNA binding protein